MFNLFKSFLVPDDFAGDPYARLGNQTMHVFLAGFAPVVMLQVVAEPLVAATLVALIYIAVETYQLVWANGKWSDSVMDGAFTASGMTLALLIDHAPMITLGIVTSLFAHAIATRPS